MPNRKNTQQENNEYIILKKETDAYEIQKEVRYLESVTSIEELQKTLENNGYGHRFYFHYTTLSTLLKILSSGVWKLNRLDCSNDPYESDVFASSFTYSGISSMGMWHWYSKAGQKDEVGVRIAIPADVFKTIFRKDNLCRKTKNGNLEKIFSGLENNPEIIHITDVAYWHFGKKENGVNDLLYYKSYSLPFKALGTQPEGNKKNFIRPNENQLPPYFKRAIWRSEGEVRVYIHNEDIPKVQDGDSTDPTEVFCQISSDAFSKMKFYIDPSIGGGNLGSILAKKLGDSASSIYLELFLGGKIKPEQFISFKEAELNPDDEEEQEEKKS